MSSQILSANHFSVIENSLTHYAENKKIRLNFDPEIGNGLMRAKIINYIHELVNINVMSVYHQYKRHYACSDMTEVRKKCKLEIEDILANKKGGAIVSLPQLYMALCALDYQIEPEGMDLNAMEKVALSFLQDAKNAVAKAYIQGTKEYELAQWTL